MVRTLQEIIDHADELADRFEKYDGPIELVDAAPLRAVAEAVQARASSELAVAEAVDAARAAGFSWANISTSLGTSGEAARQKYGRARL